MHAYMHTYIHTYIYLPTHPPTYLPTYIHTYIIHTYICTTYVHTYTYLSTYLHNCHPATLYNLRTNWLPAYQPTFLENINFLNNLQKHNFELIFLWIVFYGIIKGNRSMLHLGIKLLEGCFKISVICINKYVHINRTNLQIIHTHDLF
jgi:hypothetical protein